MRKLENWMLRGRWVTVLGDPARVCSLKKTTVGGLVYVTSITARKPGERHGQPYHPANVQLLPADLIPEERTITVITL